MDPIICNTIPPLPPLTHPAPLLSTLTTTAVVFFQSLGRHGDGNAHVGQALRDGWRCLVLMRDVVDIDG